MHDRLLAYIRQHHLMRAGDRVGVAVSGGADSVALLRLLLELRARLGVVLSVVHFNHRLRGAESDADEAFVRELAAAHGLEFFSGSGDTRAHAAAQKCGLEAAGRELRYRFFWKTIEQEKLFRIATAHTMDDQAETVLLRFLRGAGTRGQAGIHPFFGEALRTREQWWEGEGFVRPLLEFRRAQLRHYLRRAGQPWREDASNQDPTFARNRLRREMLPKLRQLNPALEQVLGETAEIARAEEDYWELLVGRTLHELGVIGRPEKSLDVRRLLDLPLALQRRVIRALGERQGVRLEFHHVQQILDLAAQPPTRAEKRVELPAGFEAARRERELRLRLRSPSQVAEDYEFLLPIPGQVDILSVGITIRARLCVENGTPGLPASKLGELRVRNWRPGDRYRPAHSREPKKLKELLQDRRVPAEARANWPVVVSQANGSEEIVWVPGFDYPEHLRMGAGGAGVFFEHELRQQH